mmetsp:Transcript_12002/g.28319  ORF Transcript_12002/g.28319 Transcript_12002/m.28319 type:complete len:224 (-) Transcript_12002:475-1146(-)
MAWSAALVLSTLAAASTNSSLAVGQSSPMCFRTRWSSAGSAPYWVANSLSLAKSSRFSRGLRVASLAESMVLAMAERATTDGLCTTETAEAHAAVSVKKRATSNILVWVALRLAVSCVTSRWGVRKRRVSVMRVMAVGGVRCHLSTLDMSVISASSTCRALNWPWLRSTNWQRGTRTRFLVRVVSMPPWSFMAVYRQHMARSWNSLRPRTSLALSLCVTNRSR